MGRRKHIKLPGEQKQAASNGMEAREGKEGDERMEIADSDGDGDGDGGTLIRSRERRWRNPKIQSEDWR